MNTIEMAIIDKETGEYIEAGESTLDDLATAFITLESKTEDANWEKGRILAEARLKCESPDCGYAGDNPDARFGAWVSGKLPYTDQKTIWRYRRQWEVFGHRRDDPVIQKIPQSARYKLAQPQMDDFRDEAIEILGQHDTISLSVVEETIEKLLPPKDNHRAKGTGENEWYTPQQYLEKARAVLGEIDLDPASSALANERVGASVFFNEDGQHQKWIGNVWMNPPYSQPLISEFSEKMASAWESGEITSAIALTHNYTDTGWFHRMANAATAICFTRGRIAFESPTGEKASPTQGQAFFYFGNNINAFVSHFEDVGIIYKTA